MSRHHKSAVASSARRISAMMLRHWYLLRSSWPRLLDLIYWPTVQMVTWGFLQYYIANNAGFFARAGGTFIGAVLLWDILFRGQLGFSISFLEEMYSRNLGNIMMSPLRPFEFIIALMVISVVRLSLGAVPVTFLAITFFGFNLYALVDHVFVHAADLRLLPGRHPADLVATGRLAVAAYLRLRRHAGAGDRQGVPARPDARRAGPQCDFVRCRRLWLSPAAAQRPASRHIDAERRIITFSSAAERMAAM
jgi:hypothetical protein